MARHDRSALTGTTTTSDDRLRAMQLRPARVGWMPEGASTGSDEPSGDPSPAGATDARVMPPAAGDLVRGWLQDRLPPWMHAAVERAGAGAVVGALAVALVIVVGGFALWHHGSATSSMPASYGASTTGVAGGGAGSAGGATDPGAFPTSATAAADTSSMVVDVGGKVRKPGLVTLPPGARVADAIAAAGGPLHHREIARLDLAARVSDGQLLLIGMKSPASADGSAAASADGSSGSGSPASVALNSATLEQLETLPGIGPVLGQDIIDWRTAHNGFTSIAQLQQVSGIGPATYAELSPLVTL